MANHKIKCLKYVQHCDAHTVQAPKILHSRGATGKQVLHERFRAAYVQRVRNIQSLSMHLHWQPNPHLLTHRNQRLAVLVRMRNGKLLFCANFCASSVWVQLRPTYKGSAAQTSGCQRCSSADFWFPMFFCTDFWCWCSVTDSSGADISAVPHVNLMLYVLLLKHTLLFLRKLLCKVGLRCIRANFLVLLHGDRQLTAQLAELAQHRAVLCRAEGFIVLSKPAIRVAWVMGRYARLVTTGTTPRVEMSA